MNGKRRRRAINVSKNCVQMDPKTFWHRQERLEIVAHLSHKKGWWPKKFLPQGLMARSFLNDGAKNQGLFSVSAIHCTIQVLLQGGFLQYKTAFPLMNNEPKKFSWNPFSLVSTFVAVNDKKIDKCWVYPNPYITDCVLLFQSRKSSFKWTKLD